MTMTRDPRRPRMLLVAALGVGMLLVLGIDQMAVAQGSGGPPVANVENTCRSAEKAIRAIFGDNSAVTYDGCIKQERTAREQLVKDWAGYPSVDKQQCVVRTQYMPSYVEWLTCFEMQRDVRKIRQETNSNR